MADASSCFDESETMSDITPPKAFISYKWEGDDIKAWAEQFARDLRRNGVDAFLDVWEVEYGDSFIKYMTRNIPAADVFFFLMTPASIAAVEAEEGKGGAVNFEVEIATERKISGDKMRFIPILLRGEKPANFLRKSRYVDFRDPSKYAETFTDLLKSLTGKPRRPPLLGAGTLEYAIALYRMLPPEQGSPTRPITAQMETFVGFPFYSYQSDHPSHWPPRVYEDRQIFGKSVLQFIRNSEYSKRIRAAAGKAQTMIQKVTSAPMDADDAKKFADFNTYCRLRALFNLDLKRDAAAFAKQIGKKASAAFLDLEKARVAESQKMPNRLLTIAFKHSQGLELKDVAIDFEIIGNVYDLVVNNHRPFDRARIENMTIKRSVYNTVPIPGNVTTFFRLWYKFRPLEERSQLQLMPIHFKSEATHGFLLYRLAAEGLDRVAREDLILDEGVYEPIFASVPGDEEPGG
jgi:hypothetical protein